MAGGVT
ncbi:putative membrane protein, partial [Yersinia pestis PY-55]